MRSLGRPKAWPSEHEKLLVGSCRQVSLTPGDASTWSHQLAWGRLQSMNSHPGRWWHALPDGRIQCDLCPRQCRLREGQRAFCFVRKNEGGAIVLKSYGTSTGFGIDPIEKKPLNHFYPASSVLSFGSAGCNLGCRFCQNWQFSKARTMDGRTQKASPDAIAAAAAAEGCRSVAFTYNDPVIFAEYAIDTARACHERGLQTVAVTAGYISPSARKEFFSAIDGANIDLKAFDERFYRKLCFGHLQPVLDTLRWLRHESAVWFEVTTLLIPGQNDSEEELARLYAWYLENLGETVPLHLSAFHPDFQLRELPRTPAETLTRARRQALAAGLKHVYTGNVNDSEGQSSYCAGCGELLIERQWYRIGVYRLDHAARCPRCAKPLAGRFAREKGDGTPPNAGLHSKEASCPRA